MIIIAGSYGLSMTSVSADSYTTQGSLSFSKSTSNGSLLSNDEKEPKTESNRLPQTSESSQQWWLLGCILIVGSGGVIWYRTKKKSQDF